MSSLDPRINRLGLIDASPDFVNSSYEGAPYEMFWLPKPGKPYEHVGIVHAADRDLALLYAKEQYSRRGGNCYGLLSVSSEDIWSSPVMDDGRNAFDALEGLSLSQWSNQDVMVFTLKKRGKHHLLQGRITASSVEDLHTQLQAMRSEPCINIWIAAAKDTSSLEAGPEGLWKTLPDKQYREATNYKSAEKIKAYTESRKQSS